MVLQYKSLNLTRNVLKSPVFQAFCWIVLCRSVKLPSPRYVGQYFFTMEKVSQKSKINTIRATFVLDKFYPNR